MSARLRIRNAKLNISYEFYATDCCSSSKELCPIPLAKGLSSHVQASTIILQSFHFLRTNFFALLSL